MVQTRTIALVLLVIFGCYGLSEKEQIDEAIAWMHGHVSQKLDYFEALANASNEIVNSEKRQFTYSIETFIDITKIDIDSVTKISEAQGKNITECVKNVETQFVSIIENATDSLFECIRDSSQRISKVLVDAGDSLPDVNAIAEDILVRFDNCTDDPCKVGALNYTKLQMEQVISDTASVAKQTDIDFRNIREDLECFTNVENTAQGKANDTLESVTNCTKSAEGPNNSLNHYYFINNSLIILCSFIVGTLTNT